MKRIWFLLSSRCPCGTLLETLAKSVSRPIKSIKLGISILRLVFVDMLANIVRSLSDSIMSKSLVYHLSLVLLW